MHWEKKICIRLTLRRIVGAVLAASTVANLVIVGAVFGADSPPATPTITLALNTAAPGAASFVSTSTVEEMAASTPQVVGITPTNTRALTQILPDLPWILCIKRFYWPAYQVNQGDTLFALSAAAGSTVGELMSANCLTNDQIYAGQILYVPRPLDNTGTPAPTVTVTASPTQTASPTPTATQSPTDTATPTSTDTPTNTPTATASQTPTATQTPTASATSSPTQTMSQTPTSTATVTSSVAPSATATPTNTLYIIGTIPGITQTVVIGAN